LTVPVRLKPAHLHYDIFPIINLIILETTIMRRTLTFWILGALCCLASLSAPAQTYYVSSSGNDSNSGLSAEQAWKTIGHVNARMDQLTGATVLFERGQTFIGQLSITADGLTVGAYGGGNKPLIRATRWLPSGWTSAGNNLWEITLDDAPERVRGVYRAKESLPLGRYPNLSDPEHEGFFYHEATIKEGNFPKTIVDNQLSELVNQDWTGAEIVIRLNRWRLVIDTVASISGNQISIVNPPRLFLPKNRGGYFFQNDIKTLDQEGEWSHDGEQNKLYLYSTTDPNNQQLSYTAFDYAVQIAEANEVSVANLGLFGSNEAAVKIEQSNNATVSQLTIQPTGYFGVHVDNSSGASILNCEIRDTNLEAIRVERNSEGATIKDCVLEDIALIPGRGQADGDGYSGIYILGAGGTVEQNTIRRIGYCGIRCDMTSGLIKRNFIERVCSVKDDGGGIYIQDMLEGTPGDLIVEENIIQRVVGNGASRGSDDVDKQENAEGIYLDTNSEGVTVRYNTTSDASFGLYVHDSEDHDMYENTTFDNVRFGMRLAQSSKTGLALRNLEVDRNIIIESKADPNFGNSLPVKLEMNREPEPGDNKDALKPIGKLRFNYLINTVAERANLDVSLTFAHDGTVYETNRCCGQASVDLSAEALNALYDTTFYNTQSIPVAAENPQEGDFMLPVVNPSDAPLSQSLPGGVYTDAKGQLYEGEVSVAPWRSVVLFRSELPSGSPNTPLELSADTVSGGVGLRWIDASDNEDYFVVERSFEDFENFAVIDTVAANATLYQDLADLQQTSQYFYRIKAMNEVGGSYYSNQTNLISREEDIPYAPSDLVIEGATLNWTDNSAIETGYAVERAIRGQAFERIATLDANATEYTDDETLVGNTEYSYRVVALYQGNASAPSEEVFRVFSVDNVVFDPMDEPWTVPLSYSSGWGYNGNPSAAQNNDADRRFRADQTVESIVYQLEDLSDFNLVAYTVFQTNTDDFIRFYVSSDDQEYSRIAVNRERFGGSSGWGWYNHRPAEALPAGTQYLKVEVGDTEKAPWTPQLGSMTLVAEVVTPGAPTNLAVTSVSAGQISLAWQGDSTQYDGFILERKSSEEDFFVVVDTVNAQTLSYDDVIADNGLEYTYRVRAYLGRKNLASAYSEEVMVSGTIKALTLTSMCSEDPALERRWRIRNPNAFTISVTWELVGTGIRDTVVAPSGDSFFFSPAQRGANTTRISWQDERGKRRTTVKASGGAQCEAGNARTGTPNKKAVADVPDLKVQVYPNPARELLQLRAGKGDSLSNLQLTDLSGKVLGVRVQYAPGGASLSVDALRTGVYLLRGNVGQQRFVQRVMINR
jgi:hypothetical protein